MSKLRRAHPCGRLCRIERERAQWRPRQEDTHATHCYLNSLFGKIQHTGLQHCHMTMRT